MSKMIQKFRFQFFGFPRFRFGYGPISKQRRRHKCARAPFFKKDFPERFPTSPDWVRFPGFPVGSPAPSNKLGPPPILEVRPDSDFHGFP